MTRRAKGTISVPSEAHGRVSARRATDGTGLIVERPSGEYTERAWYPYSGGAWELADDGEVGRQIAGTCDVRAPQAWGRVRRWLQREFG